MIINMDNLHKILLIISLFITVLKAVSSFVSRKIEDPKKKNIPKPEELDINIFNEIKYYDRFNPNQLDESGKNNLKNALIFKKITNKNAPIHTINLIFNCYDPAEAIYIYSRADKYIHFNNNQLEKPQLLEDNMHKHLLSLLIILSISSIITTCFLIFFCLQLLAVMWMNFNQISEDRIVLISIISLGAVFFSIGSSIVSYRMLDKSLSYLRLYEKAVYFYSAHKEFKENEYKYSQ